MHRILNTATRSLYVTSFTRKQVSLGYRCYQPTRLHPTTTTSSSAPRKPTYTKIQHMYIWFKFTVSHMLCIIQLLYTLCQYTDQHTKQRTNLTVRSPPQTETRRKPLKVLPIPIPSKAEKSCYLEQISSG